MFVFNLQISNFRLNIPAAEGPAENGDAPAPEVVDGFVEAPGTPSATASFRGLDGLAASASPAKSAAVLEARISELEVAAHYLTSKVLAGYCSDCTESACGIVKGWHMFLLSFPPALRVWPCIHRTPVCHNTASSFKI